MSPQTPTRSSPENGAPHSWSPNVNRLSDVLGIATRGVLGKDGDPGTVRTAWHERTVPALSMTNCRHCSSRWTGDSSVTTLPIRISAHKDRWKADCADTPMSYRG